MTDYEQNLPYEQTAAAADDDTQQQPQAPMPENPKKQQRQELPVRRVGTVTMGLVLILGGCVALAAMLLPKFNWTLVLKFSPILLILLGLEVVWFGSRQGNVRIKYDFLSMFVCLVVLVFGVGCSVAAPILGYYVEGQNVGERLSWDLQDLTYPELKPLGVVDANFAINFSNLKIDPNMTIQDLQPGELGYVNIQMGGKFESREEFAQASAKVLDVLEQQDLKPGQVGIEGQGTAPDSRYSFWMSGRYALGCTPEELAKEISYDAPQQEETFEMQEQEDAALKTEVSGELAE